MPINIVHGDLIEAEVDAIVNSADSSLLGGCGVDEAIHQAAGPELLEECRRLGGCKTGRAKMTGAHSLPCKYIIHTVVPTWRGGFLGERKKLASCYRTALELALEHGCESIAFPLLGTGSRRYPKDKALQIARKTIQAFFIRHDDCEMQVTLMIHNRADYQIDPKLAQKVAAYLDRRHPAGRRPDPQTGEEPSAAPRRRRTGPQQNAARSADQMKNAWRKTAESPHPESSPQADEDTCTFFQEPGVFPQTPPHAFPAARNFSVGWRGYLYVLPGAWSFFVAHAGAHYGCRTSGSSVPAPGGQAGPPG